MATQAQWNYVQPMLLLIAVVVMVLCGWRAAGGTSKGTGRCHTSVLYGMADSLVGQFPIGMSKSVLAPIFPRLQTTFFGLSIAPVLVPGLFGLLILLHRSAVYLSSASACAVRAYALAANHISSVFPALVKAKFVLGFLFVTAATYFHLASKWSAPVSKSALLSRQCRPTGARGKTNPTYCLPRHLEYMTLGGVCQ